MEYTGVDGVMTAGIMLLNNSTNENYFSNFPFFSDNDNNNYYYNMKRTMIEKSNCFEHLKSKSGFYPQCVCMNGNRVSFLEEQNNDSRWLSYW